MHIVVGIVLLVVGVGWTGLYGLAASMSDNPGAADEANGKVWLPLAICVVLAIGAFISNF